MTSSTIRRVATTTPQVYAFEIDGKVTSDDMEDMANVMNAAFDAHDSVDMLLIFRHFDGSEVGAGFDWASIKSRFRSLTNVGQYVVVGAPDSAADMIELMGKVIPVEAKTFEMAELDKAWAAVDARPV